MSTKSPHVEIYRSAERVQVEGLPRAMQALESKWRWRFRSSNGKILSQSSEAYSDPRDLVRGLELSHPGYRMRDELTTLDGVGGWYLWPDWVYPDVPVIRVRVPDGTVKLWRSRRNR